MPARPRLFRRLRVMLCHAVAMTMSLQPAVALASEQAFIAVAANFIRPAREIADAFERQTGQPVVLVSGSTGKLYAQIVNGAPFDALLSADQNRVTRLLAAGYGKAESRFTYAIGRLVLFSRVHTPVSLTILENARRIALANPRTAPYGAAAMQVLAGLEMLEASRDRFATGESISQTYQFTHSRNADVGFVALSQVINEAPQHFFLIPANLHQPIAQDAVLLTTNAAAQEFLAYLRDNAAAALLTRYGYTQP